MSSVDRLRRAVFRHPGGPRGPQLASRIGIALGTAIVVCFVTGLVSHWIQHPPGWFVWPATPVWLYRVTQGVHVTAGVAAIPLLLAKLWSVYHRLFEPPLLGSLVRVLERVSIAVLVGSTIFQLVTGLMNTAQWYPWKFFFPTTHYAMAYVAVGALAVHVAVKLPTIRQALASSVEAGRAPADDGVPRRTILVGVAAAAAASVVAVVGQSVPALRRVSVLAPRSGEGPQGVPINRTAAAAGVVARATDPAYRLVVVVDGDRRSFTSADLAALPKTSVELPIACVEGWSVSARWSGVRVRDLVAAAGGSITGDVGFVSLEESGIYNRSTLPLRHARDDRSLVALELDGEPLDIDHGYPCRLIAPSRPGVLQTKWLSRIEVS